MLFDWKLLPFSMEIKSSIAAFMLLANQSQKKSSSSIALTPQKSVKLTKGIIMCWQLCLIHLLEGHFPKVLALIIHSLFLLCSFPKVGKLHDVRSQKLTKRAKGFIPKNYMHVITGRLTIGRINHC